MAHRLHAPRVLGGEFLIERSQITALTLDQSNRNSLLAFMQKVHQGVRGTVTDSNGNIVQAVINVEGINHPVSNGAAGGWFFRPLATGEYTIKCTSPHFPGVILTEKSVLIRDGSRSLRNFVFPASDSK